MAVEYYYTAFMFQEVEPNTLRLAVALENTLMHFLYFNTRTDCHEFQLELHQLARKTHSLSLEEQLTAIKQFIYEQPRAIPFQLIAFDE